MCFHRVHKGGKYSDSTQRCSSNLSASSFLRCCRCRSDIGNSAFSPDSGHRTTRSTRTASSSLHPARLPYCATFCAGLRLSLPGRDGHSSSAHPGLRSANRVQTRPGHRKNRYVISGDTTPYLSRNVYSLACRHEVTLPVICQVTFQYAHAVTSSVWNLALKLTRLCLPVRQARQLCSLRQSLLQPVKCLSARSSD